MEQIDGRYYAFHFDDISAAVNYCGALVPHVVTRLRDCGSDGVGNPAIWFHTTAGTAGCELLMTPGAVLAAVEGLMPAPHVSPSTRTALPAGAVLVLGEDTRQAPVAPRARSASQSAPQSLTRRSA